MDTTTLTREAVMAMEAGEELDCLVAERVMGIVPRDVRVKAGADFFVTVWTPNPALSHGAWGYEELKRYGAPRPYSTDIAAAWELVELMQTRHLAIGVVSGGRGDPDVHVWACDIDIGKRTVSAHAKVSAPLAIARAALLTTL